MAYTVSHNTPSVGYVSWANMNIQYEGVSYSIANGSTNRKYIWWDMSYPTVFKVTDTFPNLTNDDVLVIYNKNGTAVVVPNASVIPGDLIVPGSIAADHLSANCVTGDKILAGAVSSSEIAANSIGASHIVSNSILANHIKSGAILADHIAANQITADHLVSEGIDANAITVGTLTGIKLVSQVGTSKIEIEGDEFRSYTNNQIAVKINDGYIMSHSLELRCNGGTPYIDFSNDSSTDYDMRIMLNSNNQMQIAGGSVGIGKKPSTSYGLDVAGTARFDVIEGTRVNTSNGTKPLYITRWGNTYEGLKIWAEDTNIYIDAIDDDTPSSIQFRSYDKDGGPVYEPLRISYGGVSVKNSFGVEGDVQCHYTSVKHYSLFQAAGRYTYATGASNCLIYSTPHNFYGEYNMHGSLVLQSRSSAARPILFVTGNPPTQKMRLEGNGNLSLGKRNSGYKIDAAGSVRFDGAMVAHAIELRKSGHTPYIDFSNDSSTDYDVRLILFDNYNLSLQGGNLIPEGDNKFGVGHPSIRWARMCAMYFTQSSNRDIKDGIQDADIKDCYNLVKSLRLRIYKYKKEIEEKSEKAKYHTGVVTEEAPDAITDEEKMNINLYEYCSQMLGAIQEMQIRIEKLERMIV